MWGAVSLLVVSKSPVSETLKNPTACEQICLFGRDWHAKLKDVDAFIQDMRSPWTLWIWKWPLKWQVLNRPEQLQKDFVQDRALYHQNTKWEGTVWKNCVHFSIQTNLFSLFLEHENEIRKIPSSVIYKINKIPRKSRKKFCKCAWSDVC